MADSYTPLDRDAVVAILDDVIDTLDVHEPTGRIDRVLAEAADRIVELAARTARDRARRAEHPLTIAQAPRLGWWCAAIDVDGEPKIAGVKFYPGETDVEAACGMLLAYPVAVPGADACMIDVSPVREAEA